MADLRFSNHGSIWIVDGASEAGKSWLDANVASDAVRWGNGVVVEPRYVGALLEGAVNDGLVAERG